MENVEIKAKEQLIVQLRSWSCVNQEHHNIEYHRSRLHSKTTYNSVMNSIGLAYLRKASNQVKLCDAMGQCEGVNHEYLQL